MGHFGHEMGGPAGHGPGCGCQTCMASHMACKKKMLMALVFFCMTAMISAFMAGMIHLKLHAISLFKHH